MLLTLKEAITSLRAQTGYSKTRCEEEVSKMLKFKDGKRLKVSSLDIARRARTMLEPPRAVAIKPLSEKHRRAARGESWPSRIR